MAQFNYQAIDPQGQRRSGVIKANSISDSIARLHAQSLYVLTIRPANLILNPLKWWSNLGRYGKPKAQHKVNFFRQLAMMLRAGHTLTQGLMISAEMSEKRSLQNAIVDMLIRIRAGSSFAAAMEAQGKIFPAFVPKLIASAELSGEMPKMLERLADNLEQDANVKRQLIYSMTYPTVLFLIALGVFLGLSIGIVPKLAKLMESKSQQLPAISQAMLDVSAWITHNGISWAIALAIFFVFLLFIYRTAAGKKLIDSVLINLPIIGTNIRTSAMAQMGWTMSMLLRSGQTVLDSLHIMGNVTNNHRLAQSFHKAGEDILAGRSLTYGFQQSHFPLMVQHMSSVGERSGELENVMQELGRYYQHHSGQRIKTMIALIEPILILTVGGMVAFVYIGFFKAMMQATTG